MNKYIFFVLFAVAFLCFSFVLVELPENLDTNPLRITIREGTNMSAALSPDKKALVVDIQGTLWTLPVGGGKAFAITDPTGDCHEPTWSPDGRYIAFHSYQSGNYKIWIVKKDGTDLKQITSGISDDREPSWSPDGRTIIFSSDRRGNNYDLWAVDLETKDLRQITSNAANDHHPAVSPDGKKIAFVSQRQQPGIYVLEDDKETLIAPAAPRAVAPSWSDDGSQLIYVSMNRLNLLNFQDKTVKEVSGADEDIFPFRVSWLTNNSFLYTANGKIQKRVIGQESIATIPFEAEIVLDRSPYKRKHHDFDDQKERTSLGIIGPVVSPDGGSVAFTALGDIYVQQIGGAIMQITNDPYVDVDADWSPDGKTLVYTSDRGGRMQIWLRDMLTGKSRMLTEQTSGDALMPSWSPSGKKLAFYIRNDLASWGQLVLTTLEVATGEMQTIRGPLHFPGKPAWSADGMNIVLMAEEPSSSRYREGINKFMIVSLQGEPIHFVSPDTTRNPGMRAANGPAWSPDRSKMAYIQDGVLWVVPVNGNGEIAGQPKQMTNGLADKVSWSGDSESIVYLALDKLKKIHIETGKIDDIPVNITWKQQIPKSSYIIHAGKLFNGRDSTYLYNVDIRVEANRIKSITPHQTHGNATVIDASGKVVMPGLFESHSHMQSNDGDKLGKIWLSYGITSVRETGADPYDALERKESWSGGARPGPRLFYTGSLMDGNRVYYGLSNSVTSKAHLNLELQRAERLGFDLIKTYVRMSNPMQKEVIAAAHKMGIPVSSHEIYPAAGYNADAVEHLAGTSRLGYSQRQSQLNKIYDDVIQITSRSGITITPTIVMGGYLMMVNENPRLADNKQYKSFFSKSYIDNWVTRASRPNAYRQMEDYRKAVKLFMDYGGNVTAGTDSPQVPYGTSLHSELWLFVQAGLSPYQALQSATINAARAVGVDKDLGSIEPGKLADMVIVDGNPLHDISDAWNVNAVFKNGIKYTIDELLPKAE